MTYSGWQCAKAKLRIAENYLAIDFNAYPARRGRKVPVWFRRNLD